MSYEENIDSKVIPHYHTSVQLRYWTTYPEIEIKRDINDCFFLIPIANRVGDRAQDDFQGANEFTTGIFFDCPSEYRLEIIGSDKLVNQGYVLPHPVVVTHKDKHEIKIKLLKVMDKDDLILPYHACLIGKMSNSNYIHVRRTKRINDSIPINNTQHKSTSESVSFY